MLTSFAEKYCFCSIVMIFLITYYYDTYYYFDSVFHVTDKYSL